MSDQSGFEFRHKYDNARYEVLVRVDQDANLSEMAEAFQQFLIGVGYSAGTTVTINGEKP